MSKVCIFDIDNTLTHGTLATNASCCKSGEQCIRNETKYQPSWPDTGSGTSQFVLDTIQECKNNGYDIAIATAESGNESLNNRQREFIKNVIGEDTIVDTPMYQNACTAQGFNHIDCSKNTHQCCTNEYNDKSQMYRNIMDYKGIPKDQYYRSIVFDDSITNS